MLQRCMLQTALSDLPLAFEFVLAVAHTRQTHDAGTTEAFDERLEVGVEEVVLAQLWAVMLRPIASSLSDLVATNKVVLIKPASYGEASGFADILEAALNFAFASDGLNLDGADEDRYPLVVTTSASGFRTLPDRALSAAFRTGAPVICLASREGDEEFVSSVAVASDIIAIPVITRDIVVRVFLAAFGQIPDQLAECVEFEKLNAQKLGAIVRPTRPIADCIEVLLGELRPRKASQIATENDADDSVPLLDTAVGYGPAREWATDLAADYALWKIGELDWPEIADRGLLLSGAPGTGKSTFPKLLARFMGIPLINTSVAEWNAHRNLSGTLEQMNSVFTSIRERGGILFIDELDGIGRRDRSGEYYRAYWDQIVNQLLTLISEALATPGVVIIGATNYPDRIDRALLRSGRIERHIHLDLPDAAARAGIIRQYARAQLSEDEVMQFTDITDGCSGADLQRLIRNAAASARRRGEGLGIAGLLAEVDRPLRELGVQDRRRVLVYMQGQGLVAEILTTKLRGGPAYPTIDGLRDQLTVLMAGRVAEEMILGQASILGETDLSSAKTMADAIEMRWGLGTLGLAVDHQAKVEAPVGLHLRDAAMRASRLLTDNLAELQRRCSSEFAKSGWLTRAGSSVALH